MARLPDAVFVIDPKREAIATKEANKLGIPVIGLVDTNCDPERSTTIIPGNDDAIRSSGLIIKDLARAIEEGAAAPEPPSTRRHRGAERERDAASERGGARDRRARAGPGCEPARTAAPPARTSRCSARARRAVARRAAEAAGR